MVPPPAKEGKVHGRDISGLPRHSADKGGPTAITGDGLRFDEELSRRLEANGMAPEAVARRNQVLRTIEVRRGERALDVGCGPGFLCREMATAAGPSGRVVGVDVSPSMVSIARARSAGPPSGDHVGFVLGEASRLPLDDGTFDVAVSTQVYEYVHDVDAALAELHRVLRPGGRALVVATDWESVVWHSRNEARMRRILAAWDEHLADPHLPRTLAPQMRRAGFQVLRRDVMVLFNPEFSPTDSIIDIVAGFVAGRRGITKEEANAWADDLRTLGEEGAYFFSRNQYLFLGLK